MRDENRKSVCERYNKTAKDITYEIGDVVLLRNEQPLPGQTTKFRNEFKEDEYEVVQINSPHSIQLRNIKKDTWNKRPVYVDRIKKIFVEKRIQHTETSAYAAECTDHTPNARAEPIPKRTDSTPKKVIQSTEPETVSFTGRIISSRPLGA